MRNVYVSNSDMVKLPADLYKYLMIITATCGRGKTHFALSLGKDGLLAKLNAKRQRDNLFIRDLQDIKPEEVIYLPPRKAITSQQLQNINCVEAYEDDYSGNYIDMTGEREGKIRVATAHKFAEWIKQGKIQKPPKIIILDELHSIFAETIFAESLIYISEFLKANWNDTIKIGLSATP